MRIVELIIDEDAELYGIDAISLVDRPAIELDFIALKEARVDFAEADTDKRILVGPALVPDKPIYRKNGEDEFYVYFSKKTVRKAAELYLKHGNQTNHTLEHEHNINGLTVVESWMVEDKEKDKARYYGLDVPVGTWMVAVKVDNEAIWQEWVKEGKVKGFSIEGYFVDKMKKNAEDEMLSELAKAIVKRDGRTKSGTRVVMESYSDYPEAVSNNAKEELNSMRSKATSVPRKRERCERSNWPTESPCLWRRLSGWPHISHEPRNTTTKATRQRVAPSLTSCGVARPQSVGQSPS